MLIGGIKMSLAFLGIVSALSIDNELRVVTLDCYERLAIGQRLNPSNVYKTFKYNTVTDCKKVCSEEKSACKAFGFGISAKGNATCELSKDTIKETGDLKPIGTVSDTDFDLYIKKIGCTLVTEPAHPRPPSQSDHISTKPITLGNIDDEVSVHGPPAQSLPKQPNDSAQTYQNGVQNVQTLVSVASGPHTSLHPTHGIIVADGGQNGYSYGSDSVPTWNDYEHYFNYNSFSASSNHNGMVHDIRPLDYYPDVDRHDYRPNDYRYGDNPPKRPHFPEKLQPLPDRYGSVIPHPNQYYQRPTHNDYPYPNRRPSNDYQSNTEYHYNKPTKPFDEKPVHENYNEKHSKPVSLALIYEIENPIKPAETNTLSQDVPNKLNGDSYYKKPSNNNSNKDFASKPIITHSTSYNGERITSIITEIKDNACFRRVLAGKRISRSLVRRALTCETVEECQTECGDEKLFLCEGFNYRLDPSGRGKGDCELLSVPLSRIDVYRDSYPDPDYDYYEKDRNAASANCRQRPTSQKYGQYYGYNDYDDYRHGYGENNRYGSRDRWIDRRYDYEGPRRPSSDYRRPERLPENNFRPPRPVTDQRYDYYSYDYGNRPTNNRRNDYSYLPHSTHYFNEHDRRYSGAPRPPLKPIPYDHTPYDSPPPEQYYKYQKNKYWGLDTHRYGDNVDKPNAYLPPRKDAPNDWGLYHTHKNNNYDYWVANKYGGGGYLPPDPVLKPPEVGSYLPVPKPFESVSIVAVPDSSLLPVEHRRPTYGYPQDECSLRSVTGFKLHKRIVKKYFAVPNIYECELLCFRESDFQCNSYAYRYTITASEPSDNCYLSNVDYKELDNYTDLEPDRDFDVYTMSNKHRCMQPITQRKETSDCFWRVRSGERLHDKIVRDSLKADSIVDCQIECLKSKKFTCRAFSYRYGNPTTGRLIDNCQLTDWPYHELDPIIHFILEPGFEIYERGSFGHGCENFHSGTRVHHEHKEILNPNQLCYVGFGSPARLIHQAIKKSVRVSSEAECKEECSRARLETLFQCMSFSFRTNSPGSSPNCDLSDIYQRDLLPKLDYVYDPHSLLFAWDNYNPECVVLGNDPLHTNHIPNGLYEREYIPQTVDTWRVYSVSGWPCKKGALCQQNRETGFWFCEIEGGDKGAWDYCCKPQHQCGASNGYPYLWCYVGPEKTQWRTCNERYYPYLPDPDRFDDTKHFIPDPQYRPQRPSFRPDRIPAHKPLPPPEPSLDHYEMLFNEEFLEPPKPGGLGQARRWPVAYLHKEMPPNMTESKIARMETEDTTKYTAIQNLIDVIKSNDLKNIQYQISNESNKKDDVLLVKIPLPTNFTKNKNTSINNTTVDLEPVTVTEDDNFNAKRFQKSLPQFMEWNTREEPAKSEFSLGDKTKPNPVYRRAFVTRTNVTTHGRHF